MTVFASSTSTTVLVRTSFCRRIAVHLPPEFRTDMVWVSGLLCIGTSTVVGAPNCLKGIIR